MVAQYYQHQFNVGQKDASVTWRTDSFSGDKVLMMIL